MTVTDERSLSMMHRLLRYAVEQKASDLHILVGMPPVLRVDGEIIVLPGDKLKPEQTKALLYSLLSDDRREAFEQDWYLCFSYSRPELGYFRITLYYHKGNVEAAIRVGRLNLIPLEETGLPPVVKDLTRKSTGLVLITGPTGAGKTTTFNAMIDFINRERRCKIITVEDPVEYVHENRLSIIVQQEVHADVKSFHQALINILRQDPDVIGVGEMRDLETISTALMAAETGHLVLATLHTGTASETINRIIDVFPPHQQFQVRVQLAACLQGIVSQRLLPRIDQPGRVLAYEILVATPAVRNLIREGKSEAMIDSVIETGRAEGMKPLDLCLRELYEQGIITYDTAVAHAINANRIRD